MNYFKIISIWCKDINKLDLCIHSYTIFSVYFDGNRECYVKKLCLGKRVAVRSRWEYNNHIFP